MFKVFRTIKIAFLTVVTKFNIELFIKINLLVKRYNNNNNTNVNVLYRYYFAT